MIYLDTSLLAAVFFREPGSARHLDWLERRRRQGLSISAWSLTEMASAGSIKQRTGTIDSSGRQLALSHFQRFATDHFRLVEVDPADFRTAAVFLDAPLNLRAGDALHLAVARRVGGRLATLDRRMREAATGLDLPCFALA